MMLLSIPAPSPGKTVEHDDRIAVTRPDATLLPIGIVKGGKGVAHATGFLVSECHVLTVKHAAGRVAAVAGRRLRFRLPFAGAEGTSVARVVAAGDLDLVGDPYRLDRSEDWLLLRLDRCLGARFGYYRLDPQTSQSGPFRTSGRHALSSAGFPIDQPWRRQLTVDPQCRVRAVWKRLPIHDCSSLPGNSGSPIFTTTWRDGRASMEVVAMHSTADVTSRTRPSSGEGRGMATWMADVVPAIRNHLAGPSALAAGMGHGGRSPRTASR